MHFLHDPGFLRNTFLCKICISCGSPFSVIVKLCKHHPVVSEFSATGLFEFLQQIGHMEFFLLLALYIIDDTSFMHHYKTVAHADRVFHVVGHHHCSQFILFHYVSGEFKNFSRCLRIKGAWVSLGRPSAESMPASVLRKAVPPLWSYDPQGPDPISSAFHDTVLFLPY